MLIMNPVVVSLPLTEISPSDILAAGALIDSIWPHPDRGPAERAEQLLEVGRAYTGPEELAPRSILIFDDDNAQGERRVIAYALVFPRTVAVETPAGDRTEMTVLALSKVVADPTIRGQGLGRLIVEGAFKGVDEGGFPFALFQTTEQVQPFYERLGAVRVDNRIVNSLSTGTLRSPTPEANPFWDGVVMRYPSGESAAGEDWPTGTIDLLGEGY